MTFVACRKNLVIATNTSSSTLTTPQKEIVKLSITAVAEATATGSVLRTNACRLVQVEERSPKTTEVNYFSKGHFRETFTITSIITKLSWSQ